MKKVLVMFVLAIMVLVIAACDEGLSAEERIEQAKLSVVLEQWVTEDIILPTQVNEVMIQWSSNRPERISNVGVVVRPTFSEGDVQVELMATFTYQTLSDTEVYLVTVRSYEQSDEERLNAAKELKLEEVLTLEGLEESEYTIASWNQVLSAILYDIETINSFLSVEEVEGYVLTAKLEQLETIASVVAWFELSHSTILNKNLENVTSDDLSAVENAILSHELLASEVRVHLVTHKELLDNLRVRIGEIIISNEVAQMKTQKISVITTWLSAQYEVDYMEEKWQELIDISNDAIEKINNFESLAELSDFDTNLVIVSLAAIPFGTSDQFAGSGNERYPYLIETAAQLIYFSEAINNGYVNNRVERYNDPSKYFVLSNNISLNDLSNFENWETVAPENSWIPIGASTDFIANFDGQNYNISGIFINDERSRYNDFGLFGSILNTTVKNVILKNSYIKAVTFLGGIAGVVGTALNSTIINVHVLESWVIGGIEADSVGGVTGKLINGTIENSTNYATVVTQNEGASFSVIGGIVGTIQESFVINSMNFGTLIADGSYNLSLGGIAGLAVVLIGTNTISDSNNYGTIMVNNDYGLNYVGGIVGQVIGANLSIAYYDISRDMIDEVTLEIDGDINIYISNSHNYDEIIVQSTNPIIGGIVGQIAHGSVVHNYFINQSERQVIGGGINYLDVVVPTIENRITNSSSVGEHQLVGEIILGEHYTNEFYP